MSTESDTRPVDAEVASWVERVPYPWRPYLRLARLDRPIGAWLLYWPCIFGLALGALSDDMSFPSLSDLGLVAIFGIGAVAMRGAGCTYNDIVDRKVDAEVARTRLRPIPSGDVSVTGAWIFLLAQCAVGFAVLVQLNALAMEIGAASLLLIALYPFMKRITWWPQFWLGLTFNWGALVAFAAKTGRIDWADVILYAGLIFWTLGYDTLYALQDKEDDALVGVKSTARLFGAGARDWIEKFYVLGFALILASGFADHAGWPFAFLMILAGAHLLWQSHRLDMDDPEDCLMRFKSNREAGAMMALAFIVSTWAS